MDKIHVMSPDELKGLKEGAVAWQESRVYDLNRPRVMPMVMFNGIIGNFDEYCVPDELRSMDDTQLRFRYWNKKPLDYTMDMEPWIIREEWRQ